MAPRLVGVDGADAGGPQTRAAAIDSRVQRRRGGGISRYSRADREAVDPAPSGEQAEVLGVLGSLRDVTLSRLQASQAFHRMISTAELIGLKSAFHAGFQQIPVVRQEYRRVFGGASWPQALL
jgi:hypothetical protein